METAQDTNEGMLRFHMDAVGPGFPTLKPTTTGFAGPFWPEAVRDDRGVTTVKIITQVSFQSRRDSYIVFRKAALSE